MRSDPPVRQLDQPRVPAPPRTSGQVRRFAVLWALAAAGVLAVVMLTSVGADSYRSEAARRATAADTAQSAATSLLGSMVAAERPETRRGITRFAGAVADARSAGVPVGDAGSLVSALRRWEASTTAAPP
jgi:hypothetical protein